MKIIVTEVNFLKRNTLQGFATVDFLDCGFEIPGFAIHEKEINRWVELPAKPPTDPGSNIWPKIMEFYDKRKEKEFKKEVLIEYDKFICSNTKEESINED